MLMIKPKQINVDRVELSGKLSSDIKLYLEMVFCPVQLDVGPGAVRDLSSIRNIFEKY